MPPNKSVGASKVEKIEDQSVEIAHCPKCFGLYEVNGVVLDHVCIMPKIDLAKSEVLPWWEKEPYYTQGKMNVDITTDEFERYDLPAIITEANARRDAQWIEMLESMKLESMSIYHTFPDHMRSIVPKEAKIRVLVKSFNTALDQAIANKPK